MLDEIVKLGGVLSPGLGIWTCAMLGLVYFAREWRATRQLSAEDRLARREGYAKQVEGLQVENRRLREDIREMEVRHAQYRELCHAETESLRVKVNQLLDQIAGLHRQELADRVAVSRLPATASPDVVQAARRAEEIHRERE